jgi:hypothetical protein
MLPDGRPQEKSDSNFWNSQRRDTTTGPAGQRKSNILRDATMEKVNSIHFHGILLQTKVKLAYKSSNWNKQKAGNWSRSWRRSVRSSEPGDKVAPAWLEDEAIFSIFCPFAVIRQNYAWKGDLW